MPPKKGVKGKEPVVEVVSEPDILDISDVTVSLKISIQSDCDINNVLRIRLISKWLKCCITTDVYGSDLLPWEIIKSENEDNQNNNLDETGDKIILNPKINNEKFAIYTRTFEANIETIEQIQKFNEDPFITAVILDKTILEEKDKSPRELSPRTTAAKLATSSYGDMHPISFAAIDCSSFITESEVEGKQIETRSQTENGISLIMTVKTSKPFIKPDLAITFEPVMLDIQKLSSFPLLEDDSDFTSLNNIYLYGSLNFGGYQRIVYARPMLNISGSGINFENTFSDTLNIQDKTADICMRICLLPGASDLAHFKESLTSSTFVIQVHKEDIHKRAFHDRNKEEYVKISFQAALDKADVSNVAPVLDPKGKPAKAAPPPAKGAPLVSSETPSKDILPEEINAADQFLLQCISKACNSSGKIRAHGTVSFRLEQLLDKSVDLLTEFGRTRHGIRAGDDKVIIKEEMLIEVKLAKPSKPERWARPDDMSLRSALNRAVEEEKSMMDGTLAVTTSNFGASKTMNKTSKNKWIRPVHEQFRDCGTRIIMCAELLRKLDHPKEQPSVLLPSVSPATDNDPSSAVWKMLQVTPFTRMVIIFKYEDDTTLLAILAAMGKVNKKALPNIQGSLRSYSFSDKELIEATKGQLDVITGFQIIDDDLRMVVLEGLAGPGQGMQSLFLDLPRKKENSKELKILCNPEVLFPHRLYGLFGPDVKTVRIREKLKKLAKRPELYNRKQVEELCFSAIDSLMTLRRSVDLISTKDYDVYPSLESINKVELLYGDAISRADLDGKQAEKNTKKSPKKELTIDIDNTIKSGGNSPKQTLMSADVSMTLEDSVLLGKERIYSDCRNPIFEEYLSTRPQHRVDYLHEQNELKKIAWENTLIRRSQKDKLCNEALTTVLGVNSTENSGGNIFIYSSQTLNFRLKAFQELRQRLSKKTDAIYTFSQEFVSQTISPFDEDMEKKRLTDEKKSSWLTSKGFQYPATKTRKELITHPKRPVDARIDELNEQWSGDAAPSHLSDNVDHKTLLLEKGFITQIKSGLDFGSLEVNEYEREFELKLVGDKNKLPRGKLSKGFNKDPAAFRSIHIGGDNQAKMIEEAITKEKEDWAAKVVVDTLDFKISAGFVVRDSPIMMDRANDILVGEPKRLALLKIREAKTSSGKDIGYKTTPLSILSTGMYKPGAGEKLLLRLPHKDKFVTAGGQNVVDITTGLQKTTLPVLNSHAEPKDFIKNIHKDANTSKVISVLSKKKHPPIDRLSDQCKGPRWGNIQDSK